MKFTNSCKNMDSNRRAVATCRAELEIAENLAEALKHEIEVRECHLKIAQATLRDEALVYCQRKVGNYRPELGTCDDEHWKVVKDWTGLKIVEVQPEQEGKSHEQEVVNLKTEVEELRRMNDSLRKENGDLKARADLDGPQTTMSRASPQQKNEQPATRKITKDDLGQTLSMVRRQSSADSFSTGRVRCKDDENLDDLTNGISGHGRYSLNFQPPNAIAQAQAIQSQPLPSFESRYGITPAQVLECQEFTKMIELANFYFIVTAIKAVPTHIFQERSGGAVDCGRFQEIFAKFIELCVERKLMTDGELERDEASYGLYMELRNSGGRAAERWEMLLECEREFL